MDSDLDLPDDLNDLDEDLFGIGNVKNKNKGSPVRKTDAEKKRINFQSHKSNTEYDDDDPLAGLLSDDEDNSKSSNKKQVQKKAAPVQKDDLGPVFDTSEKPSNRSPVKMRRKPTTDLDFGADDILGGLGFDEPLSKPTPKKEAEKTRSLTDKSSFMDSLFGEKDNKKVEKEPAEKEFVLGDKYKKKGEDEDIGGYKLTTTTAAEQPRRRRPAMDKIDYQPSFTLDEPTKQSSRSSNGAGRPSSSGLDWLGSGPGDSTTSPKRDSRVEETRTPERRNKAVDWLDGGEKVQPEENKIKSTFDWMDLKSNLKGNVRPATAPNEVSLIPEKDIQSPKRLSQRRPVESASPKHASPTNQSNNSSRPTVQAAEHSYKQEPGISNRDYESIRLRHEEEIKSVENFYKNQIKTMEETRKESEQRIKTDLESRNEELKRKLSEAESDKQKNSLNFQEKTERIEREHKQEIERLKELHGQALLSLREDHEDALKRLQRLKEQEIEAISSAQNQTKSLQMVMEELQSKTGQLTLLQEKLDGKHRDTLDQRQEELRNKEKQLKILEDKLENIQKEGEDERTRLQELVLRLEKRLQDQSATLEEERWQVLQEKGRLEAKRKALEEDRTELENGLERDKAKLHQAKELILQEQKTMLSQMSQERLLLVNSETQLKRKEEELSRRTDRLSQEEKKFESEMRSIRNEYHLLSEQKDNTRAETAKIKRARDTLEEEKDRLKRENEQLQELAMRVKKRSEEIEEMCLNAVQSREEGHNSLIAARQLESNCNEQKLKITEQLQNLHLKEQRLMEQKVAISTETRRLEETKSSLICASCKLALIRPLLNTSNNYIHRHESHSRQSQSTVEEPSLLIWKIRAQKDREFLEHESQYLQSLRRSN